MVLSDGVLPPGACAPLCICWWLIPSSVTERYLWSFRPLMIQLSFRAFCADRRLCTRALAQNSSGGYLPFPPSDASLPMPQSFA